MKSTTSVHFKLLLVAVSIVLLASYLAASPPQGQISGAGGLTDTQLRATPVPVSGPLTDTQLRATPVPVSGTVTANMGALVNGVANIGITRSAPSSCTQSTNFTNSTVGIATGAGTSVTSTTTCITKVFVNNTSNAAVTFRLQDKTGTPIIWVGGNADFSIAANSNFSFPLEGTLFVGGITAISGTAAALNLQISGLQ